jgi:hypothetical protein
MELKKIIEINGGIPEGIQTLVPCLIGGTGVGKTTRAAQLAEQLGLPVVRLLPGTELPEDILGYPRPVRQEGVWKVEPLPRGELLKAAKEPVVLLVDEIDKAREETLSALLTLFAERRVRNLQLHPATIIIAAMQPVEPAAWLSSETGKALAARLLFLPCAQDQAWAWLRGKYRLQMSYLPTNHLPSLPILPEPVPRVIEYSIHFVLQALGQGLDKEDILATLQGCLPGATAAELIDEITASDLYDPFDALAQAGRLGEWAQAAPVGELVPHLVDCMVRDWAAGVAALERVLVGLDPDAATEAVRSCLADLHSRVEAAGGVLEIPDGLSEEQGAKLLEEALRRVAKAWALRKEAPENAGWADGTMAKAKIDTFK